MNNFLLRLLHQPALKFAAVPFLLLAFSLSFSACTPIPAQTTAASPTALPAATQDPAAAAIQAAWESSPHANTYDLSKGPNTYCARCHSPQNWDPAAVVDPPPNCVSCKFAFEQEVRVAAGNPLVPAEDWQHIGCEICHPLDGDQVQAELAWLDTETGYHETVSSPSELCENCHTDTETLRHRRELGTLAHAEFTCVACHDAHSTAASCTTSGCHPALDAGNPIPGHDTDHTSVSCVACHDAAGLVAEPLEGEATWMTWRTTSLLGRENKEPYQSHNLQRTVDCARCHYPGNPWELRVLTESEQ